jgi:pimeloyl-ACP methyl ester carboxylesterase
MFAEYGPVDGVPVLAFHGTPQCRLRVEPTIRIVTELGIRLITYDRPGCGGSDRMVGRTVADSAGDARAILDAVDVERCAVSEGSGGTPPAMAFAALCPERVIRLALQAPIAPRKRLGPAAWSSGQDAETVAYMTHCLQGRKLRPQRSLPRSLPWSTRATRRPTNLPRRSAKGPGVLSMTNWRNSGIGASSLKPLSRPRPPSTTRTRRFCLDSIRRGLLSTSRTRSSWSLRRWATATVVRTAWSPSGACTGGWPRASTSASRRTRNATHADTAAAPCSGPMRTRATWRTLPGDPRESSPSTPPGATTTRRRAGSALRWMSSMPWAVTPGRLPTPPWTKPEQPVSLPTRA